jgi:hypothetical protein
VNDRLGKVRRHQSSYLIAALLSRAQRPEAIIYSIGFEDGQQINRVVVVKLGAAQGLDQMFVSTGASPGLAE